MKTIADMDNEFKKSYHTIKWQVKKSRIMERDHFTCQMCGAKDKFLNVHHKTYKNCIGNKCYTCPDEDLVTLCEECHKKVHCKDDCSDFLLPNTIPHTAKLDSFLFEKLREGALIITSDDRAFTVIENYFDIINSILYEGKIEVCEWIGSGEGEVCHLDVDYLKHSTTLSFSPSEQISRLLYESYNTTYHKRMAHFAFLTSQELICSVVNSCSDQQVLEGNLDVNYVVMLLNKEKPKKVKVTNTTNEIVGATPSNKFNLRSIGQTFEALKKK